MRFTSLRLPITALLGAFWLFLVANPAWAQSSAETNSPSEAAIAEQAFREELLKTYVHLQEELRRTQLALDENRAEAKMTADAQAREITEKLAAIQATLAQERLRQQQEMEKSNRTLLWVAGIFGVAGMGAMVLTAVFQWRAVNRMTELMPLRAQLTAGSAGALLAPGSEVPGKVVELSNQRLMAVIERLERRVFELEHSAVSSEDSSAVILDSEVDGEGDTARIASLLSKGQSFLNTEQPEQALECYDEILRLDENHSEALVKKGAVLERLKQDDEALRCYDRAIEADRTLTIAYLYKGGIYNRLERYNEALECYEQALRTQGQTA